MGLKISIGTVKTANTYLESIQQFVQGMEAAVNSIRAEAEGKIKNSDVSIVIEESNRAYNSLIGYVHFIMPIDQGLIMTLHTKLIKIGTVTIVSNQDNCEFTIKVMKMLQYVESKP